MNDLTNTTQKFLKRFEESLPNGIPNKKQAEKLIESINDGLYELNHNDKIIVIYELQSIVDKK